MAFSGPLPEAIAVHHANFLIDKARKKTIKENKQLDCNVYDQIRCWLNHVDTYTYHVNPKQMQEHVNSTTVQERQFALFFFFFLS